jgi:ubiquinone/menaquinone biosynthesis C-methylase UbiE
MQKEGGKTNMADTEPKLGSTEASYIMESPREGARLEAKTDPDVSEQQLRSTGLERGMRALDVGCGTGALTRTMARIAAPGRVVGVDISASRLRLAREFAGTDDVKAEFIQGDAHRLPLPSASFDYAWSRYLFEYLSKPARALAELSRVTRPGGTVVVADLDGQLGQFYPLEASMQSELLEALRVLGEVGFDPQVGRKLYHWFCRAGLHDIDVSVVSHQVYTGGLHERDLVYWREKLSTARDYLIEHTGDRKRWQRLYNGLLAELRRPDLFYYCSLIIVRGSVAPN